MSDILREYVVTLKDKADLEQFYLEMENPGSFGFSPKRAVECVNRRPISRNTHYLLAIDEAEKLKDDFRVEAVEQSLSTQNIKVIPHSSQTGTFSRGYAIAVNQRNWALDRCQLSDNIYGWGSDQGTGNHTTTVNFTATGKNVDVIVCDGTVFPGHVEFGSRVVQYNWFSNHNAAVWPANSRANYTYTSFGQTNNHATQVASIIGGTKQGWAKEANIYNIIHDTTERVSDSPDYVAPTIMPTQYIIDYIRAFHNSKAINNLTGVKNPTLVNNSWGLGYTTTGSNILNGQGKSTISKVYFRGTTVTADSQGEPIVDIGFSGVCNATTLLADLSNLANGGNRIVTTGTAAGTCTGIPLNLLGRTGITDLGLPTAYQPSGVDRYDDSFWQIVMPFQISYCNGTYGPGGNGGTSLYISSNSFIQFGGQSSLAYTNYVAAGAPTVRKILVSGGDRYCQAVYAGVSGTTPNRTYRVRWEGHDTPYGSVPNSPTIVWEATFYEATPTRIDLHVGQNSAYRAEFTSDGLNQLGILQLSPQVAPQRNAALDADIADAIADGIVFVGSAGNGGFKIDNVGGTDYNNYFVDNGKTYYYHRGSSPGASNVNAICVGGVNSTSDEPRLSSSNTGPRVDVYAPAANVISAVYDATGDPGIADSTTVTEQSGVYQKYTGTSIGAAQVSGVLALALETYPKMTPLESKTYITSYAKVGKMYATNSSNFLDSASLQGGNNRFLYYNKERSTIGFIFPKINYKVRPTVGVVFPRTKIRRT